MYPFQLLPYDLKTRSYFLTWKNFSSSSAHCLLSSCKHMIAPWDVAPWSRFRTFSRRALASRSSGRFHLYWSGEHKLGHKRFHVTMVASSSLGSGATAALLWLVAGSTAEEIFCLARPNPRPRTPLENETFSETRLLLVGRCDKPANPNADKVAPAKYKTEEELSKPRPFEVK
eukprot:CAMPEP_0178449282 /NCGR_PEP_ID=MMETSP0689_2-20121128/42458_1 /TAXON_ID=160604 /ORGANISM="Amphidinium massartii, Strain CS-259" /LENGTH=172 /DNA_ID=CAMNT_0020074571 /DNA_START=709 /DNA_END=1227 /DNA_ORIENTATION=+